MSRAYEMHVDIEGYEPERAEAVKNAANNEWPFDGWYEEEVSEHEHCLSAYGQCQLGGGETEDEFAQRLAIAIWKANQRSCCVIVQATFMEELPYESYILDEEDYKRWRGGQP